MNPITVRKRLLVAESDLNRARCVAEVGAALAPARRWLDRTVAVAAGIATTATAIGELLTPNPNRTARPRADRSWIQSACDGVELLSSIWSALRPRRARSASDHPSP
ncbi:MAG: hypothetical protein PF961_18170 [Planctomycetota bacterium]|jgi:hypothetical protein|nr:hypothetical protein [Planctomycetota bacterium]